MFPQVNFKRYILWALFDIKSKNNEQCIKLHYIVLNVHSGKPGLLLVTLFCTELISCDTL